MTLENKWDDEEVESPQDINKDLWKHFKVGDIVEFEGVNETPLRAGIIKDINIPESEDEPITMDIVCIWNDKEIYTIDLSMLTIGLGYDDLRFIKKLNDGF